LFGALPGWQPTHDAWLDAAMPCSHSTQLMPCASETVGPVQASQEFV
jgi:hypothetical protein